MALKSIEQEWQGFSAMVFRNAHPSDTQLAEMKKAFFAGAWAMFCATAEIGCDHVSEDEGFAFLEARRAECNDFKQQMLKDYADTN